MMRGFTSFRGHASHVAAMPRKQGYNWRARQSDKPRTKKHLTLNNVVEGAVLSVEQGDTNYLALPSKREAESSASQTTTKQKRPRLGKKQKKRLKKVVQAKEKTAKRKEILERLQELQIPQSEQSLLQSSTGLGQKKTAKSVQLLTSDNSIPTVSLNSPRRKRKRKQKLRIEKQLITLTHPTHSSSEDESSDDSEEDVSVATCSVQTSKGETSQEVKETSQTSKSKDVGSGDGGNDVGTGEVPVLSQPGDHSSENELEAFTEPPHPLSSSSGKESSVVPVDEGRVLQDSCPMEGTSSPISREKAVFIPVHRNPAVQAARLELPILGEEQVVMETINENPVTVLCGETGSGKTTQVPQFLYEAGYTRKYGGSMIGITQPRRVAAVSMSKRVAEEMNLSTRRVSYQIRYEGNVSDETEIKFMTDGVLLKEIERDFLLTKYSVIMIDEAHERSVFTDILIGLLSRIVPLREKNGCPLKMIISSATLRVEDFTDNRSLFSTVPPVVKVDSRQFPVTVHFNKRTPVDYITEAYRKVCKIHRQLKDGSILVFVTGQKEVHDLCRKLRNTFVSSASNEGECKETEDAEKVEQLPKKIRRKKEQTIDLDRYSVIPCDNGDDGNGDGDVYHMDEEEDSDDGIFDGNYDDANDESYEGVEKDRELPLLVLPLYSMLSSERQALVFEPPPEGVRLCVVATNVAETSLTIPNMKYVVDTGKVKSRYYDGVTGISTFRVEWTSKASANQRAGRAGRTEPGHCYRLYSSAVFENDFRLFSEPEIMRRPIDDLVLQMKAMNIDRVVNFPFPTSPDKEAMEAAEKRLVILGSLSVEDTTGGGQVSRITPLGMTMAQLPVAPHFAKMLCLSRQHGCLPYMIAIVAGLSVKELFAESDISFLTTEDSEQKARLGKLAGTRRAWAGQGESLLLGDLMVILKAIGCVEYVGCTEGVCRSHGLRYKAMMEVRKLRAQLTNSVNSVCSDVDICVDPKMEPPSNEQLKFLRQIVLSGLGDHVARKIPTGQLNSEEQKRLKYAYQCVLCEDPVFLHPASVLVKQLPEFAVFQEILETSKKYMRGITAVEGEWLPMLLPQMCTFSKPLTSSPPFIDPDSGTLMCCMSSNYGPHAWPIPVQNLPYPEGLEKYKVFGQLMMEGKVFKDLKQFTTTLLCTPVAMVKTWGKLHRCTEVLLTALAAKEAGTKEKIKEIWKEDPKYLLKAVSLWLPQSKHRTLVSMWPPKQ